MKRLSAVPSMEMAEGKDLHEDRSGMSLPSRIILFPIAVYRRWVSPGLPRRCKYEPTCSAYAVEAVSRFGAARGTLLAVWRLARCNPFSHGGFDPVRDEFTLKVGPMDPAVYHGEKTPPGDSGSDQAGERTTPGRSR